MRCIGFLSSDGGYAYCSREEHAGQLDPHPSAAATIFAHRLAGECRCGLTHGDAAPVPARRSHRAADADEPKPWTIPTSDIEMVHQYRLGGELQFEIVRIWKHARSRYGSTKTFPRHVGPDGRRYFGQGRWKGSQSKPLYRQDEAMNELRLGGKVFFVEGERDCDALWDALCIGTCNPDGAGSFREAQAARLIEALRDGSPAAELAIVADDDETGIAAARRAYRMLAVDADLRSRITVLLPPAGCKDVAEYLTKGAA